MRLAPIGLVGIGLSVYLGFFFGCGSDQGNATCTFGYTGCGPTCVDVNNDVHNCGTCGTTCISSEVCVDGGCTLNCTPDEAACPTTSPTLCANLEKDPTNCGACGHLCPDGEGCVKGACTLACPILTPDLCIGFVGGGSDAGLDGEASAEGGANPEGGTTTDGGSDAGSDSGAGASAGVGPSAFCTDLANDAMNCGTCGTACPAGAACVSRTCTCEPPLNLCDAQCTDSAWDPRNCGTCGINCGGGLSCILGRCGCPGTLTACDADAGPDAGVCKDTGNDYNNCGSCGHACGIGQILHRRRMPDGVMGHGKRVGWRVSSSGGCRRLKPHVDTWGGALPEFE